MNGALAAIGAGAVALAVAESAGDGSARDALAAIEITTAVVIVLAVAGLLALLVYRVRRERLTYRPDPCYSRARAEVVGIVRTAPRALPTATVRGPGQSR